MHGVGPREMGAVAIAMVKRDPPPGMAPTGGKDAISKALDGVKTNEARDFLAYASLKELLHEPAPVSPGPVPVRPEGRRRRLRGLTIFRREETG